MSSNLPKATFKNFVLLTFSVYADLTTKMGEWVCQKKSKILIFKVKLVLRVRNSSNSKMHFRMGNFS